MKALIIPFLIQIVDQPVLIIIPPPTSPTTVTPQRNAAIPPPLGQESSTRRCQNDKHILDESQHHTTLRTHCSIHRPRLKRRQQAI